MLATSGFSALLGVRLLKVTSSMPSSSRIWQRSTISGSPIVPVPMTCTIFCRFEDRGFPPDPRVDVPPRPVGSRVSSRPAMGPRFSPFPNNSIRTGSPWPYSLWTRQVAHAPVSSPRIPCSVSFECVPSICQQGYLWYLGAGHARTTDSGQDTSSQQGVLFAQKLCSLRPTLSLPRTPSRIFTISATSCSLSTSFSICLSWSMCFFAMACTPK